MGDIFHVSQNRVFTVKDSFEKKAQERKKNILYLIKNYLQESGYEKTLETFIKEAKLSDEFEICDNIDIDTIVQEYTSYYFAKFNKHPKICKKISVESSYTPKKVSTPSKRSVTPSVSDTKISKNSRPKSRESFSSDNFEINIKQISNVAKLLETNIPEPEPEDIDERTPEMKELVALIKKEMVTKDLGISWQDCIGLENVIQLLKEAIIYPIKYPFLFGNQLNSWKGVLLFGPPGTGKTLVARALASECKTTFINVCPSTFISKWRGESEKMVKTLFEVAKQYSPTTIFIDEVDALASSRDEVQHEASKRFKSELLTQMDGLLQNGDQVFILATTNIPWNIDKAMLRRFEKKVFVNLPNLQNRTDLFKKYLYLQEPSFMTEINENDVSNFAAETNGFSGSDIKIICKNSRMKVVRRNIEKLEHGIFDNNIKTEKNTNTLLPKDVRESILGTKPLDVDLQKYFDWDKKHGCL